MSYLIILTYSATIFLSALLLFSVQPMLGKMLLPLLGGVPQVWNTCLFFFQMALLTGYYYAHLIGKRLTAKCHLLIHIPLLLIASYILPIHIPSESVPPIEANPIPWLLITLLVYIGLPFILISASSPLIQKWFSHTKHRDAKDPYFLYAASNAGSLMALLCYPFLLEPYLSVNSQSILWSQGYLLLILLSAVCLIISWQWRTVDPEQEGTSTVTPSESGSWREIPLRKKIHWLLLALVPASLIYGVTTHLSTDIAAVPLLWIIPLSIYLISFIFAFMKRLSWMVTFSRRFFPIAAISLIITFFPSVRFPIGFSIFWHLWSFFIIAMYCHGELAKNRPPAKHLTEFYLWLSLGGVLGGAFNALLAPLIFNSAFEYPLMIVLACALWTKKFDYAYFQQVGHRWFKLILPIGGGIVLIALLIVGSCDAYVTQGYVSLFLHLAMIVLILLFFRYRPVKIALAIAFLCLLGVTPFYTPGVIFTERSFFGIHRIVDDPQNQLRIYANGNTIHGVQSQFPALQNDPGSYFHRTGPIGQIIKIFNQKNTSPHVAVIGLGVGSLAAYARPDQKWTFYEIDPVVKRIATDPKYFTFLKNCKGSHEIVMGDGRHTLQQAPDYYYGLIVIDAFTSDSIPIHLMTKEAIELYLRKLTPDGILAFHISNRYLKLANALGPVGRSLGLTSLVREDFINSKDVLTKIWGKKASTWLVMVRKLSDLNLPILETQPAPGGAETSKRLLWTDDYSNILSVLRWK